MSHIRMGERCAPCGRPAWGASGHTVGALLVMMHLTRPQLISRNVPRVRHEREVLTERTRSSRHRWHRAPVTHVVIYP